MSRDAIRAFWWCRKMCEFRNWAVLVVVMTCFYPTFCGDHIYRPTQRSTEPDYAEFFRDNSEFLPPGRREISHENYQRQNVQNNQHNVGAVRHTHTSTRVDLPEADRHRNVGTTLRSQAKPTTSPPRVDSRSNNKRKSQAYQDDSSRMVYPSELEELTTKNSSVVLRSRSCFDGLCDRVDNYPTDMVNRILSKSKDLKKFFSTKISEVIVTTTPKIHSRFGEGDGPVEPLCITQTQTRYPQSAVNMNNVEQLLVNVDNYKQGIAYETCAPADVPCKFSQTFPQDYISSCTQRYTVRKLMVVSKESDNPVFDDFRIPSCCVCTVKMVPPKSGSK